MDGYLQSKIQEIRARKNEKNKKVLLLSVISVVLALTVSYLSVFPAITMKGSTVCGLEEHTHTAVCYEDALVCDKAEDEGHAHNEACYTAEKSLVCTLAEDENHIHDESCYKTELVLTCGQEEREAHTHTAECYEKRLICGMTEHVHTQDCYRHDFYEEDLLRVYEDDDVTVTVTLTEESMIPEEAQLVVFPITEESDKVKFDALAEKAGETALEEDQIISDIRFYDISFQLDGVNIEPAEGSVKVSIRFNNPVFLIEDMKRASELKVLHFEDSGSVVDVTDLIENAEEGITAIEFSTESFSVFSIVLADTTQTGNFYQRVTTIDSTTASYLIVAAQGNYALSSTQTGNSRLATINPVKGNPTYYNASIGASNASGFADINWFFNTLIPGTSGTSTVQVDATHRLRLGNATFISATAENQTLNYTALTKCWTIVQSGYYLYMTVSGGSGVFSRNNTTTTTDYRNLLIYKLVNTTLTIPGDVVYDDGTGTGGGGETKPTYPAFITPSGAKSAAYSALGKTIAAVSDPASSQIESKYNHGIKANDGKVVTDKSVIYGDDDYGAFTNYADGEFGVAMSALGQEFNIAVEQSVVAPIDVVVILDTSGSMVNSTIPTGETRALAAVNALNDTIDYIMTANPDNRVGVVNFSSGSWDFMQLGRYYVGTAGATINYTPGYDYVTISNSGAPGSTLATNTALRFANTRALATSVSYTSWLGTHTQLGMAQAAAMMLRNTDTTYTPPGGETVNRTPVIIMISDGDPTHCTTNYMDALNGPHYGSGNAGTPNNQGILGYNTILSGKYYKMQTSIHYKEVAKWFSIGLGIYATGYDDMSGSSATGDHVKRAVLYPTTESIDYLNTATSAKNYATTGQELYQLLNGTYSGDTVTVSSGNATTLPDLGQTNRVVPVLKNQYTNYKYADDGFFGNFTSAELNAVLQQAINQSREVYNYGFILQNATDIDMSDPLGVGMEVKAPPILRHNGVNYTSTSVDTVTNAGATTVTYHYDYTVTDTYTSKVFTLNDTIVTVITDPDGKQTVRMFVYEHDLPVYQPDQAQSFYYEELPVRLLYKVGLTASALASAHKNDVFYTNRWDAGITTTSSFFPTEDNPYYVLGTYQNVTENKTVNSTSTISTKFQTDLTGLNATHYLGNNGKLTITDAPETVAVTVNKVWYSYGGAVINDPGILATLPDITVNLYQSTSPGGGGTLYDTVTFGNDEGWTYTWPALPDEDGGGNPYYYSVTEAGVDGYFTAYQNNGGIQAGTITVDNTAGGMILPDTGGVGLMPFIAGGLTVMILILMIAGCLFYIKKRSTGRRFPRPPDG